jgi:23S rRNA (guanosine2251-2'-O)-methyltransferase
LLVVPQRRQALERIVLHATTLRIPIVEVEGGSLTSLAGFDGHQGIALVVAPRRFASLDDILARAIQRGEPPLILVLDSLEDPQNVGTLLRSAEAAGAHGVVFPTERQAPLSPAAIKASAGATEHLLLAPVDDLPGALADLHVHGLRVLGSDADAPLTAREADLRGPVAIVVGSEGHGLSPAVRRRCDLFVRIPMRGAIGSLNAAVAGSVLLFEALGQRDPAAKPRPSTGAAIRSAARDREPDRLEAALELDEAATSRTKPAPELTAGAAADDEAIEAPAVDDLAPQAPAARRTRARKTPVGAVTNPTPDAAGPPVGEPPAASPKPARARRATKPPTPDA